MSEKISKLSDLDEYSDGLEAFVETAGLRSRYSPELLQDRNGVIEQLSNQVVHERINQCQTPKQFRQFSKFLLVMKNLRPLNSSFDKADFFSRASKVQFTCFEDLFWVWQLAMKEGDPQFNLHLL